MFFIFLLSSLVPAQVIIKEKVEINPQGNILPEYPQSSFDPCLNIHRPDRYQSVYSCIGYPVEPIQQIFPWQAYNTNPTSMYLDSATIYNIRITSGTEYAYFFKATYWDTVLQVPVEPEYLGTEINGLTGAELCGWGELTPFVGTGLWEREHQSDYQIVYNNYSSQEVWVVFEITDLTTGTTTDWHTTVVNPTFVYKDLSFELDTIPHHIGMPAKTGVLIDYFLENELDNVCQFQTGCPPDNIRFSLAIISGQQYGQLIKSDGYYETVEYSTTFNDLTYDDVVYYDFYYTPDGSQPDSAGTVVIRISSNDSDLGFRDYTFYVKRNFLPPVSENGSIVIETDKNTVMSGDTLDVLLRWEDGLNGIIDFSDWQEFGVWLADGFEYGTLLNPNTGDTSDAFPVIGKQFKLVVNQNITDVNKKILIAAETQVDMLGGPNSMQRNTYTIATDKKIKAKITAQKKSVVDKNEDGIVNTDFIISFQYLSGIKEIVVNPFIVEIDPPTVSAGDTARIIPKFLDENGNFVEYPAEQTFEIGMIDGCVLGKLSNAGIDTNYFYGITQPFYFIADSSADSGNVNIRVGVIEMNLQNRSLTINNNIIPESDNPVEYCFLNDYQTDFYVDANVVVGDECDFDNCGDSYDDIQIEVVRQYNFYESGYFVVNSLGNKIIKTEIDTVCFRKDSINNVIPDSATGQSRPLKYHRERKNQNGVYEYAWNLKPCKNSSGKIEVRPVLADSVTPTPIYIDFMADICYTSISNDGYTLITDTTQLSNIVLMPDTAKIIHDLCGHRCYPQLLNKNGFVFKEIVERHELLHMEHFKQILADTKKDSLVNELKSWATYTCQKYNDAKNENTLDTDFLFIIKSYFRKAENQYWKESGYRYFVGIKEIPSNPSIIESNEKKIHYVKAIYDLVDKYHLALHNARGTTYPYTTCAKCP